MIDSSEDIFDDSDLCAPWRTDESRADRAWLMAEADPSKIRSQGVERRLRRARNKRRPKAERRLERQFVRTHDEP